MFMCVSLEKIGVLDGRKGWRGSGRVGRADRWTDGAASYLGHMANVGWIRHAVIQKYRRATHRVHLGERVLPAVEPEGLHILLHLHLMWCTHACRSKERMESVMCVQMRPVEIHIDDAHLTTDAIVTGSVASQQPPARRRSPVLYVGVVCCVGRVRRCCKGGAVEGASGLRHYLGWVGGWVAIDQKGSSIQPNFVHAPPSNRSIDLTGPSIGQGSQQSHMQTSPTHPCVSSMILLPLRLLRPTTTDDARPLPQPTAPWKETCPQ